MLHMSRRVDTPGDVDAFLSGATLAHAIAEASSVLVQVFWNGPGLIAAIAAAIRRRAPGAVLVGADSAGQIADGIIVPEGAVVSASCFTSARLEPFFLDVEPGREYEAGRALADSLSRSVGLGVRHARGESIPRDLLRRGCPNIRPGQGRTLRRQGCGSGRRRCRLGRA